MRRGKKAGLRKYRAKRRFGVTAEPKGKVARKRGNAFVIQKHAATRLHYDLRLELDGVMKSWAVTRGPSLVPGEKRLAVEVEDHPIAYNKFEGTIPKGEYGGGTVMIWDRGHWEPEADPRKGLAKGHLAFRLYGEKLQGGWHLVRMHRRQGEKRDNWLLIKQHDGSERSARDEDILEQKPLSVVTGRTMDEITSGQNKEWRTNRTSKTKQRSDKPKATAREATARSASKPKLVIGEALRGARKASLPRFVSPSLATLSDKAPDGENWVHEIKFDGYRIQAQLDRGKVKLFTRKGLDWTEKFPTIAAAISKLRAKSAVFDGELVTEDGCSRTSRTLVMIAWFSTCLICFTSMGLISLLSRFRPERKLWPICSAASRNEVPCV
jgi:bifunctional non-homologous end joining protein LigD